MVASNTLGGGLRGAVAKNKRLPLCFLSLSSMIASARQPASRRSPLPCQCGSLADVARAPEMGAGHAQRSRRSPCDGPVFMERGTGCGTGGCPATPRCANVSQGGICWGGRRRGLKMAGADHTANRRATGEDAGREQRRDEDGDD